MFNFKSLQEVITKFSNEDVCKEYLEQARWNGKPVCPHCDSEIVYRTNAKSQPYKCGNSECYKKFSVTVGLVMENSKLPLSKWFIAIYLGTAHKKGISSLQLSRDLGITQKSAWHMMHRIREAMRQKVDVPLSNTVEVDEVYMGGKVKNMSKQKRTFLRENDLSGKTKTAVMGLVERDGNLKLIAVCKNPNMQQLVPVVLNNVDKAATLVTDSAGIYSGMGKVFSKHEVVNHAEQEYVRDNQWHTNTIEGAFSQLKRSIYGIYHQVTPKHLSRYCDETMFRYNLRKMKDGERFNLSLTQLNGKLLYKSLVNAPVISNGWVEDAPFVVMRETTTGIAIPILKVINDEVIERYSSISEAARFTGISKQQIHRVLKGKRQSAGGFGWKYE